MTVRDGGRKYLLYGKIYSNFYSNKIRIHASYLLKIIKSVQNSTKIWRALYRTKHKLNKSNFQSHSTTPKMNRYFFMKHIGKHRQHMHTKTHNDGGPEFPSRSDRQQQLPEHNFAQCEQSFRCSPHRALPVGKSLMFTQVYRSRNKTKHELILHKHRKTKTLNFQNNKNNFVSRALFWIIFIRLPVLVGCIPI